jgi:hypothetical protein
MVDNTTTAVPLNQLERYYRPKVQGYYRLASFACSNVFVVSGTCER